MKLWNQDTHLEPIETKEVSSIERDLETIAKALDVELEWKDVPTLVPAALRERENDL